MKPLSSKIVPVCGFIANGLHAILDFDGINESLPKLPLTFFNLSDEMFRLVERLFITEKARIVNP